MEEEAIEMQECLDTLVTMVRNFAASLPQVLRDGKGMDLVDEVSNFTCDSSMYVRLPYFGLAMPQTLRGCELEGTR